MIAFSSSKANWTSCRSASTKKYSKTRSQAEAPACRDQGPDFVQRQSSLAERTGRGIDRIFEGMLRYGRTAPDYSRSSAHKVSVRMSAADADAEFLRMIVEREEQTGTAMPIDSLIILSRLRNEWRTYFRVLSAQCLGRAAWRPSAGI